MIPKLKTSHKLFLQHIMAAKSLTLDQINRLYKYCFDEENIELYKESDLVKTAIHEVNEALFLIGFEIKKGLDQEKGTLIYCMVNLIEDEISQLNTTYTQLELNYLRTLIDGILKANNKQFALSTIQALEINLLPNEMIAPENEEEASQNINVTTSLDKITKVEREILIDKFVEDQWLKIDENAYIVLTTRFLLEQHHKILDSYWHQIFACAICDVLVTKGFECKNQECRLWFHKPCISDFHYKSSIANIQIKCPKCKSLWEYSEIGKISSDRD